MILKYGDFILLNEATLRDKEEAISDILDRYGSTKEFPFIWDEYKNTHSDITVICKIHKDDARYKRNYRGKVYQNGGFKYRANELLSRHIIACPCCSDNNRSDTQKYTTEEFIELSIKKHGNRYNYSNTVYNGMRNTVKIICPKHGEFEQTAFVHTSGCGCPTCNLSKLEKEIRDHFGELFEMQKTFKWLKFKKYLKLDFFNADMKLAIECQGEQHFTNIEHFKDTFEERLVKDKAKFELCKANGIEVIYYYPKIFDKHNVSFYNDKKCFHKLTDLIKYIDKKRKV